MLVAAMAAEVDIVELDQAVVAALADTAELAATEALIVVRAKLVKVAPVVVVEAVTTTAAATKLVAGAVVWEFTAKVQMVPAELEPAQLTQAQARAAVMEPPVLVELQDCLEPAVQVYVRRVQEGH
jgi:hypothetical protein